VRILIDDDAGPGRWAISCEATRSSEGQPTQLKLAGILSGLVTKVLLAEVLKKPLASDVVEARPAIALPGIDFAAGAPLPPASKEP
jgi:hypothetical protein